MNPLFTNDLIKLIIKHEMIDTVDGINPDYIVSCVSAYVEALRIEAKGDEIIPEPIVESTQEKIVDPEASLDVTNDIEEEVLDSIPIIIDNTEAAKALITIEEQPFEGNDHTNDGAVELPNVDDVAREYIESETAHHDDSDLDPEILKVIDETPVPEYVPEVKIEDLTPEHQKKAKKVLTEIKDNIDHVDDRFDKEGWITYNKALASTDNFIKRSYIKKLIRLYPNDEELPQLLVQWS